MSAEAAARRVELPKRQACFHCSKVLTTSPKKGVGYVGFALSVDGFDRMFHQACIANFLADVPPEETGEDS